MSADIVVVDDGSSQMTVKQFFGEFSRIAQVILTSTKSDTEWQVIKYRFGFDNVETKTLEEIGSVLGVKRQRVQQIEEAALLHISRALFSNTASSKRQNILSNGIAIRQSAQEAKDFLADAFDQVFECGITENPLLESVSQRFSLNLLGIIPTLALFLDLLDCKRLSFKPNEEFWKDKPIWVRGKKDKHTRLKNVLEAMRVLLTQQTSLPQSELEVAAFINKRLGSAAARVTLSEVPNLVLLCEFAETLSDGRVQGKFCALRGRGNQVERILYEAEKSCRLDKIVREINARLLRCGVKDDEVKSDNLVNQLSKDKRFVPIGKSGEWALAVWDPEGGEIVKLMVEFLKMLDRPATEEEFYDYVHKRRPVERSSITLYLSTKPIFKKMTLTGWGLANWRQEPGEIAWTPREVADFVAQIFKSERRNELEYTDVRQRIVEKTGASETQAQGMLNQCGAITTEVRGGTRIAIYKRSYKNDLGQPRVRNRKKPTLRQQIGERAYQLLDEHPQHEMTLADLIMRLQGDFPQTMKPTLYQYIDKAPGIGKRPIPNTRDKIVYRETSTEE